MSTYKLTLPDGGGSFLVDDLTMGEMRAVEHRVGESWVFVNPFRSSDWAIELTAAFLARSMDVGAAREKVEAMPMREVLDAWERVDEDLPVSWEQGIPKPDPKAATDAPATTG